jgi:hypothetical protein
MGNSQMKGIPKKVIRSVTMILIAKLFEIRPWQPPKIHSIMISTSVDIMIDD